MLENELQWILANLTEDPKVYSEAKPRVTHVNVSFHSIKQKDEDVYRATRANEVQS